MDYREAIEYFHLYFSNKLAAKIERSLFCLKGGCNLRFYFNSIRYSEDIDFDVHTISVSTLKKNVSDILNDKNFRTLLKHKNLEITEWSAPKQTEVTQRWKVRIRIAQQALDIPTKIEFSRRKNKFEQAEIKPIDSKIINQHQMQIILLQHYNINGAIEQKINALINRTETQARDIIDLHILKNIQSVPSVYQFSESDKLKALETLMSVSFDQFRSQVWPYLIDSEQSTYKNKDIWNHVQENVCSFIENQVKPR